MLHLPQVQLILLDGSLDPLAEKVIEFVTDRITFGDVMHIRQQMSYEEAMQYQARYLGNHLPSHCTHQLSIECDGFPVNPHHWTDDFLSWDYIGAPWPANWVRIEDGSRVGNGGCALRSRAYIEAIRDVPRPQKLPGDVYWCQHPPVLDALVRAGCKFAPLDVAMRWALEERIPEFPQWDHADSFGFHKTLPKWKNLLK